MLMFSPYFFFSLSLPSLLCLVSCSSVLLLLPPSFPLLLFSFFSRRIAYRPQTLLSAVQAAPIEMSALDPHTAVSLAATAGAPAMTVDFVGIAAAAVSD